MSRQSHIYIYYVRCALYIYMVNNIAGSTAVQKFLKFLDLTEKTGFVRFNTSAAWAEPRALYGYSLSMHGSPWARRCWTFRFLSVLTPYIGAHVVGEIYNNNYINRTRRFVYSGLLCEFTDTCEDFNDSENLDGLTVVLAHTLQTIIFSIYIPPPSHVQTDAKIMRTLGYICDSIQTPVRCDILCAFAILSDQN